MLPDQETILYKNFVELVHDYNLEAIIRSTNDENLALFKILDTIKLEEDVRHNNRCILFQLLKSDSPTIFNEFADILREQNCDYIANKLDNKLLTSPLHKTSCFKSSYNFEPECTVVSSEEIEINVKLATKFCDTEDCYRTRSKNRGHVLIINNIQFDTDRYQTRRGAETDENNLKELFGAMGFIVELYRNLTIDETKSAVNKFTKKESGGSPDIGIVIIMSHGEKVDNKTVIIGSDGNCLEEEWIIEQFNNQTCLLFKNKPKILVFNVCRGELVDNLAQFAQHTQFDSALINKQPDGDDRYYSDLIICHPSVKGFQAHRDTIRGCWYIELICKVFMDNSNNVDVESMLKMVEKGLKTRISEKRTRQTSTFVNIAFKTCYFNPGIYEQGGVKMQIK